MKKLAIVFALLQTTQVLVAHTALANANCQAQFASSPDVAWRATNTHAYPDGSFSLTSSARESRIQSQVQAMQAEILYPPDPETPYLEFFSEEGVQQVQTEQAVYQTGKLYRYNISGLGPSGVLKGTLLLPVSGHTGIPNATKWKDTDTYTIKRTAAGEVTTDIILDAKSLDFITAQEIEISLIAGKPVRIEYHRSGSGGPGGYFEGRTMEFTWDGK